MSLTMAFAWREVLTIVQVWLAANLVFVALAILRVLGPEWFEAQNYAFRMSFAALTLPVIALVRVLGSFPAAGVALFFLVFLIQKIKKRISTRELSKKPTKKR